MLKIKMSYISIYTCIHSSKYNIYKPNRKHKNADFIVEITYFYYPMKDG